MWRFAAPCLADQHTRRTGNAEIEISTAGRKPRRLQLCGAKSGAGSVQQEDIASRRTGIPQKWPGFPMRIS
jgi:hypothetical protein